MRIPLVEVNTLYAVAAALARGEVKVLGPWVDDPGDALAGDGWKPGRIRRNPDGTEGVYAGTLDGEPIWGVSGADEDFPGDEAEADAWLKANDCYLASDSDQLFEVGPDPVAEVVEAPKCPRCSKPADTSMDRDTMLYIAQRPSERIVKCCVASFGYLCATFNSGSVT